MMSNIDINNMVNTNNLDRVINAIDVVGFGLSIDDLTEKHKKIIQNAELLVGGKRHLELLKSIENETQGQTQDLNLNKNHSHNISRETLTITKDIQGVVDIIKERAGQGRRVVVVASGDPMFHGIGSTLVNALGRESVNIYPNISSVSAAFAAIKESWHDAELISLHGKDADTELGKLDILLCKDKKAFGEKRTIAILTDHIKTPAWLAQYLLSTKIFDTCNSKYLINMYVFENLGADNQKISFYDHIEEATEKDFASPNVVILKQIGSNKQLESNQCSSDEQPKNLQLVPMKIYPGMAADLFFHEKGLITKSEIRAIVLSKLELTSDDHIFWDLGAGSGSVSIEVSRFIPKGRIFAVEKSEQRISDIKNNMERFGIYGKNRVGECTMTVIHGELPEAMNNLPDPDRIFIGGGGKNISEIISRAGGMLAPNGIMVINTVLIQTMNLAMDVLKEMAFHVKLTQVQVSVSKTMPFGDRLEALNPVWILSGKKTG